jgi:hypothetical protein
MPDRPLRVDRSPVLEICDSYRRDGTTHTSAQWTTEKLNGTIHLFQVAFGEIVLLEADGSERLVPERSAVEEEAHTAWPSWARAKEV